MSNAGLGAIIALADSSPASLSLYLFRLKAQWSVILIISNCLLFASRIQMFLQSTMIFDVAMTAFIALIATWLFDTILIVPVALSLRIEVINCSHNQISQTKDIVS